MKLLPRHFLLPLAMLVLPLPALAGTARPICGAVPATAATPMMSRHAAIKSLVDSQWKPASRHGGCHDSKGMEGQLSPGSPIDGASSGEVGDEEELAFEQASTAWPVCEVSGRGLAVVLGQVARC